MSAQPPTPAPGFDLDAMLERAARLLALGIVAWSLWDAIGEWRRRRIMAELRRLVPPVAPAEREPSAADVDAVLRRAVELTHGDGLELDEQGG